MLRVVVVVVVVVVFGRSGCRWARGFGCPDGVCNILGYNIEESLNSFFVIVGRPSHELGQQVHHVLIVVSGAR